MTLLQGAGVIISLLLYPYLIRTLGKTSYGLYVFAFSNIAFFTTFISFGFTIPALKTVSLNKDNEAIKRNILAAVFTAKFYLFLLSSIIFVVLLFTVPFLREHSLLYIIIFSALMYELLFPNWYYQGMQIMKLTTYIQLGVRLLTIPFIFIFIKKPQDVLIYAAIVSSSSIICSLISTIYIKWREIFLPSFVSFKSLKQLFKDSLPFFWTSAIGCVKQESITLIIGAFFSLGDVAIYDLANKIVAIPRLMTTNINGALFPQVIKNIQASMVKKIIRYEMIIGLSITLLITLLGYWAVLLMGGKEMLGAYPLAIVLSFTIYSWLIVGSYIDYIFVPQYKYYFVTRNQLVALLSFVVLSVLFLYICKSLFLIILAYSLSGFAEIFYCKYLIRKHRLL